MTNWMEKLTLALAAAGTVLGLGLPPLEAQNASGGAGSKPNVVFILADNVGYGDMGPYGGGELRGYPTPRADQMAREGLRLTQFLVESTCTPSRAALMTGQYSIRNGLSLISLPGGPNTLSAKAYTMGELFKGAGYATAIYGKWHLGGEPQSQPTSHGFDEFYGIPLDTSWHEMTAVPFALMTHSIQAPESVLLEKGPWIMQQKAGGPLERVKPFTPEVRAEIDDDLTDRTIAFIKQQHAAGKPFFAYLPFSMGHEPNYPDKMFAGKSRIGNYGDKMMEGDYHVGQVLDTLKELKIDENTIVVFASDNGPCCWDLKNMGNLGSPDDGSAGPYRGELGEATEGAIRTFCFIRWPGHIAPNTTSYAMFSIMDFLPTFASILGSKLPTDRPIDGVDQSAVLFGKSETGARDTLLTFIGPDLVAARWKQWRIYFKDMHMTAGTHEALAGMYIANGSMWFPKMYNIEMDPHEEMNMTGDAMFLMGPVFKAIQEYEGSVKKYPNPPASNLTNFTGAMD
ncbi:MAG: arylsulfatase [Terriglobales bacterium]|jgi:arylsulfatase